jgi:transcriptional regulator with XRE-family HTH domain
MVNHSNSSVPVKVPHRKAKGKTKAKHTMIAGLIARGFSVKDVAQKVNLSESHISHLLSDKDSFVNVEIFRMLSELFAENDRHLIDLFSKALQKLDNMFSSSDEEKQFRAIDRIIKIFLARSAKNPVTIQQYFGIESQEEKETADEMILRMRKERGLPELPDDYLQHTISEVRKARGLPELPDHYIKDIISKLLKEKGPPDLQDHKDSSHSTSEDSSHSSPENSTLGNSAQDASSQDAPSQDAPSQQFEEFLKQLI